MGQAEITTVDVGRRGKVCWVTDVPGFVQSNDSLNSIRETERRRRWEHRPEKAIPVTDVPGALAGKRLGVSQLLREDPTAQSCQLIMTCLYLGPQVVGSSERVAHKAMHTEGLRVMLMSPVAKCACPLACWHRRAMLMRRGRL